MATTNAIVRIVRTTATMASRLRPLRTRSLICAGCAGASVVEAVVPSCSETMRQAVLAECFWSRSATNMTNTPMPTPIIVKRTRRPSAA